MTRHSQRGVTLIELLVAITLLTLLSAGMLMAIQMGLSTMGRTNAFFATTRRTLSVDRIVTEQIAGFVPTPGFCQPNGQSPPQRVVFFQGEQQTMRFVSTYSLQEAGRGLPRILEYQVIPGENGEGVRLIVNEHLFTGPFSIAPFCTGMIPDPAAGAMIVQWLPVQATQRSFVLADKLAYCRFSFKEEMPAEVPDRWLPRWVKDLTPAAVRIDWAPLHPDPSRIQLPPVTLPFRVTRHAFSEYEDQ